MPFSMKTLAKISTHPTFMVVQFLRVAGIRNRRKAATPQSTEAHAKGTSVLFPFKPK